MKHCPAGGLDHKAYYVRLSVQVVQCMADGCNNRVFLSLLTEKDKDWKFWSGRGGNASKLFVGEGEDIEGTLDITAQTGFNDRVDRLTQRVWEVTHARPPGEGATWTTTNTNEVNEVTDYGRTGA